MPRFLVDGGFWCEIVNATKSMQTIDPHIIFWILLPLLLYEDAADCHWHVMARVRYLLRSRIL